MQKKCIHECLEENKPSKSPPPPTEPGKVADEVSLVWFIANYLILDIFIHSSQTTAWGNLYPQTIPEERTDEENDPVRPSPSLPYLTFSPESIRSVFFIFNSHLLIAACFNFKQHCQILTVFLKVFSQTVELRNCSLKLYCNIWLSFFWNLSVHNLSEWPKHYSSMKRYDDFPKIQPVLRSTIQNWHPSYQTDYSGHQNGN